MHHSHNKPGYASSILPGHRGRKHGDHRGKGGAARAVEFQTSVQIARFPLAAGRTCATRKYPSARVGGRPGSRPLGTLEALISLPLEARGLFVVSCSEVNDDRRLDRTLLLVVTAIIAIIAVLMIFTYIIQYFQARQLSAFLIAQKTVNPSATIIVGFQVTQSALLQISSFFLSFILIFVGALYVLRAAQSSFSASAEGGGFKTAFQTTSPGLVLAVLGVALILVNNLVTTQPAIP